jgi:hypothetical protein
VLRYRAEFNPSVVPFKRMTALDTVGADYILGIRDRRLRPEPVYHIPPSPDRDLFWGSLMLKVRADRLVPIPSVAPEARILSYATNPRTTVHFYKDSADNFWVRTRGRGNIRLVFLTDAPRRYFSPQIPPSVTTKDVPPDLRPRIPSAVKRAAKRVLKRIGVNPRDPIYRQLERLAAYFRNFEPGALPRATGDIYLDIALSQRGVCRHRSFAFVVTAQALGIPARYVQNEAHAFTEVFVPRIGWVRIDLGGASPRLQVSNARKKAIHNPAPDPFPRPARYSQNYSRLNGAVDGIRPGQRIRRRDRRVALQRYDRSRPGMPRRDSDTAEARPVPGPRGEGDSVASTASDEGDPDLADPAPPSPRREPTQLSIYTNARSVYRGERLQVWGRVTSRGSGVAGLKIELYLSTDGRMADAELGVTVSRAEGRFRTSVPVPRGLRVGEYRVYATTPGDARHKASISR